MPRKKKEPQPLPRIFNFSGGKSSAYMVLHYYQKGDLVIFQDTGREHHKTYKFINDFEAFENIPIIRISYKDSKTPFDTLLQDKKHKIIPNRVKRMCTDELKIKTAKRWLRQNGIQKFENFIGFRKDEPKRVLKRKQKFVKVIDKFPMYYDGITKQMINAFWEQKPYNLEIPPILGNCTLCFMKGEAAIIAILTVYPELATEWIADEEKAIQADKKSGTGRRYFENASMKKLLHIAQNNLFKDYDLSEITPKYSCECSAF
jgi:Phosphoadenosine phosphosulfate reductase family